MHQQGYHPPENWFSTWFNSPYYHLLYQKRDDAEAQAYIERLCQYLQVEPKATILDLACGKGRHARSFARLGYHVTGLDLASNSIQAARELAVAEGLTDTEFVIHDMRKPYAHATFDLVVNLFTSFGYFTKLEDNFKTLQTAVEALKPGGTLVIDYLNAAPILVQLPRHEVIEREGIQFKIQKWADAEFIFKQISFTDGGQSYRFTEQVQILMPDWFTDNLEKLGMHVSQIMGDYDLSPYQTQSPRLMVIAQK